MAGWIKVMVAGGLVAVVTSLGVVSSAAAMEAGQPHAFRVIWCC